MLLRWQQTPRNYDVLLRSKRLSAVDGFYEVYEFYGSGLKPLAITEALLIVPH